MDDIDRAAKVTDLMQTAEIEAIRKQLAPNVSTECADCVREIPAARKAAVPSATRCIDCEELIN